LLDVAALKVDPSPATFNLDRSNRDFDEWTFDVFQWNNTFGGHPLTPALLAAMRKHRLLDAGVTPATMARFAQAIEDGYDTGLQYHNRIHAADVVQAVHALLTHRMLHDSVTPLDRFSILIAACVHDFKHPGVNNAFLIATGSDIAVRCACLLTPATYPRARAVDTTTSRCSRACTLRARLS